MSGNLTNDGHLVHFSFSEGARWSYSRLGSNLTFNGEIM